MALTNKFKVIIESHPVTALDKTTDSVPACPMVRPFHSKGRSFSHIVIDSEVEIIGISDVFKVTIESQPVTALTRFTLEVPDSVMVIPFHSKGNAFEHNSMFSVTLSVGLT